MFTNSADLTSELKRNALESRWHLTQNLRLLQLSESPVTEDSHGN
jgi:hypothetical protein